MAKRHGRPSAQYRYEHYDPFADSALGTPDPQITRTVSQRSQGWQSCLAGGTRPCGHPR